MKIIKTFNLFLLITAFAVSEVFVNDLYLLAPSGINEISENMIFTEELPINETINVSDSNDMPELPGFFYGTRISSFVLFIAAITLFIVMPLFIVAAENKLPGFDYSKNSYEWQKKNNHLLPSVNENKAVMLLDQDNDGIPGKDDEDMDNDGIPNQVDQDIDGDGVDNQFDPSPYDWREKGYSPFGMLVFLNWNHQWNNYMYSDQKLIQAVAMLKELGVNSVRLGFLWEDIEAKNDTFTFNRYDLIIKLLKRNNIRILGFLSYSSSWGGDTWDSPPYNNEDFADFVTKVVSRYKHSVKYWEVWNEPDSAIHWKGQDGMKRYSGLLKKSYTAAKAADPSCKVLLGGLTEASGKPLRAVYSLVGGQFFDIVNVHPFVNPLNNNPMQELNEKIASVRLIMSEYGDGSKRIWLTELGSPGVSEISFKNTWWHGISTTEDQQARWVEQIFIKGLDIEGVDKIFWAFFQDTVNNFGNGVDNFGLVRPDFSMKPGFYKYKECSEKWERENIKIQNRPLSSRSKPLAISH
ncbi:MAG: endo-1,4-beta-xylanase [bacterium]